MADPKTPKLKKPSFESCIGKIETKYMFVSSIKHKQRHFRFENVNVPSYSPWQPPANCPYPEMAHPQHAEVERPFFVKMGKLQDRRTRLPSRFESSQITRKEQAAYRENSAHMARLEKIVLRRWAEEETLEEQLKHDAELWKEHLSKMEAWNAEREEEEAKAEKQKIREKQQKRRKG